MADLVFNIALGKVRYYAELPGTNDALIAVPIETTGIESDALLRDYDTLSALLAGASNEQTTMGRKTLASVATAVDDTGNKATADAADFTYTAASGNAISAFVICYDPDTTAGTDADLIPLVKLDRTFTPTGADQTFVFDAAGFWNSASAA